MITAAKWLELVFLLFPIIVLMLVFDGETSVPALLVPRSLVTTTC